MKKTVIKAITLLIAVALIASSVIAVGAAGDSVTKIYAPEFLNQAGDGVYQVKADDEAFPDWIQTGTKACVPTADPSNFGFSAGIKYTDPKGDSPTRIYMKPMAYSQVAGYLMYVKTPANSSKVNPAIYLIYSDGNSMIQKFQWGYVNWYTMQKGTSAWAEAPVSGYGPTLPNGFEGYLYIPFETILNNGSTKWKDTDKICGIILWSSTGADEITYSMPAFVDKATLGSNRLPSVGKVMLNDVETTYFQKSSEPEETPGAGDSSLPAYDGEKIDYGAVDLMKVDGMPLFHDNALKVGEPITDFDSVYDIDKGRSISAVESINAISKYPTVRSFGRNTAYDGAGACVASFYADSSKTTGYEAVMLYVKMPEDAPVTTVYAMFNALAGGDPAKVRSAWIYSGNCYLLSKGSKEWQTAKITAYQFDLPAGFEGFIRFDYANIACQGQDKLTSADAFNQLNFYVPGWKGGEILMCIPFLVSHIGNSGNAAYLDGDTKCARNLFGGAVIPAEELVVPVTSVKKGDTFDSLPVSNTDKTIHDPQASDYTDSTVTVSWDATDGAAGYRAELYSKTFSMDGLTYTVVDVQDVKETKATLTGMAPDTSYSVVVRALDSFGQDKAVYESISVINDSEEEDFGYDGEFGSDDDEDVFGFGGGDDDWFSDDGFSGEETSPITRESYLFDIYMSVMILSAACVLLLLYAKSELGK